MIKNFSVIFMLIFSLNIFFNLNANEPIEQGKITKMVAVLLDDPHTFNLTIKVKNGSIWEIAHKEDYLRSGKDWQLGDEVVVYKFENVIFMENLKTNGIIEVLEY